MPALMRHLALGHRWFLVLVGLVVVALTVLPGSRLTPPSSAAAPPDAREGYAIVSVYVGGDRTGTASIGPLKDVTFGLFTNRPTAYNATGLITTSPIDGTWAKCVSADDGYCNFEVPIQADNGVQAGSRLWVAPIAAPGGWYGYPEWQTAPLSPGADTRKQTQYVFETPALQSGGRYISTAASNGFMSDPGTATSDASFNGANGGTDGSNTGSNNVQRRTASSGTYPLSRANPALPQKCGLNVALVVDLSSSVRTPTDYLRALKSAMDHFVDALQGTPSQLAIVTFGTASPANGFANSNTGLMPVASSGDAKAVRSHYVNWSWGTNPPTNYTNWDAGLERVTALDSEQHIDLTVVLTDGNPTVFGAGVSTGGSGFTRFREMENSVASANAVKAQNTRVLAVGVGGGATDAGVGANLRGISGPTKYVSGGQIASADYFQENTYEEAGNALRDLVIGECAPSISVVKQIIPDGGTIADAFTPASPWEFGAAASATTPGAAVISPSPQETGISGATNFDVTVPGDGSGGAFNLAETPKDGYTLAKVNSTGTALDPDGQNAFCVDKTHDDQPIQVTNDGDNGWSIGPETGGANSRPVLVHDSAISCVVYNRAPPNVDGSVVVHKVWKVTSGGDHTVTYEQYQQPLGLDADLNLSGPGTAGLSEQTWSEPRSGYRWRPTDDPDLPAGDSVDISEDTTTDALPGCRLTGATISGTGIDGERNLDGAGDTRSTSIDELTNRASQWTITNSVTCTTHLELVKQVVGGPAPEDSWTLHALGGPDALDGPSGTSGVSAEVTPNATYQLAERPADPGNTELLNYVQPDLRPDPDKHPESTGSVDCIQTQNGVVAAGNSMGLDGSVSVPLGLTYTCTFTNITAPLHVIKEVDGGTAQAGDFHFSVAPIAPHVEGLPSRHFDGEDAPGYATIVRPEQAYRLTESGGPDGYQLVGLDCGVITPATAEHEFTIPAGSSAVCTARNSFSTWTAEKSSNPPPGQVKPGTVITYTITARHLDGNPTHDVIIGDDLSGVLTHATFVEGSIEASAGTAHRDGDHIVWTIPVLHDVETVRYQVRVNDNAYGVRLVNKLDEHTTGDPEDPTEPGEPSHPDGDGDEALPCPDKDVSGPTGTTCDETVHTTPEREVETAASTLPDTGGPSSWWLWGGLLLICVGGTFTAAARIRPKQG